MKVILSLLLTVLGLSQFVHGAVGVYRPGPYRGTDVTLSSYYSYNSDYGVDDNFLRVGGWDDEYWALVKFDIEGLPKNPTRVGVVFSSFKPEGSSTSVSMEVWAPVNNWNEDSGMYTFPWSGYYYGIAPAPTLGMNYGLDVTVLYKDWVAGRKPNQGIMLIPTANDNRFNYFRSSDHPTRTYRPYLRFEYTDTYGTPNFKLPLPGGRRWVVTTEVGGRDAMAPGSVATHHQGNKYFGIDFGGTSIPAHTGNIPVYAAAYGTVQAVGYDNLGGGNYVYVSHHSSGNLGVGFSTYYLHLQNESNLQNQSTRPVKKGDVVNHGSRLGYLGSTGDSTGPHLHISFKYNGDGSAGNQALAQMFIDGFLLKDLQTEKDPVTKQRGNNSYYLSTNRN